MLERGKINSRQAFFLMITLLAPEATIYIPAVSVNAARQDAWLLVVVATLAALLIAWLIVILSLRFPGKTLFEYPELILGKVPGKIIAFIYVLWFIHIEILLFGQFGNFLPTSVLPGTPVFVNHILATLVMCYIARNGLEVLSRFNELYLPVFIASFIFLIILSTKDMEVTRLLPVYDGGLLPILKGAASPFPALGQIVFVAVLIPYLNKPHQAAKLVTLATLVSGFIIILAVLYSLTILGPDLTSDYMYPTFNAVRMISIANFLERLEAIPVVIWTAGGMIKNSLLRYAIVLGAAQCLGLKDYRPLVLPVGAIVVAGSLLMYQDVAATAAFTSTIWPFYSMIFEVVIPLLLLVVALARGLGKKNEDAQPEQSN